jgi:uncharacterized membrane protein YesL
MFTDISLDSQRVTSEADATRPGTLGEPPRSRRDTSWSTQLYHLTDTICFLALLNLAIIVGVLAGLIVAGIAPSIAAAVECSRTRQRGDAQPLIRAFITHWRSHFVRANLLWTPGLLLLTMLASNELILHKHLAWLTIPTVVAALIITIILVFITTLDAHYILTRRQCVRMAVRFACHTPANSLLIGALVVLMIGATMWMPGLSLISLGATAYLCTALTSSFFTANDQHLAPSGHPADH